MPRRVLQGYRPVPRARLCDVHRSQTRTASTRLDDGRENTRGRSPPRGSRRSTAVTYRASNIGRTRRFRDAFPRFRVRKRAPATDPLPLDERKRRTVQQLLALKSRTLYSAHKYLLRAYCCRPPAAEWTRIIPCVIVSI